MQTPEEFTLDLYEPMWRGHLTAAALIRARDAEVAEAARAETLAGFTEERAKFWEHDEGTGRLRRATTGVVCTRLVGPWEPDGGEQS